MGNAIINNIHRVVTVSGGKRGHLRIYFHGRCTQQWTRPIEGGIIILLTSTGDFVCHEWLKRTRDPGDGQREIDFHCNGTERADSVPNESSFGLYLPFHTHSQREMEREIEGEWALKNLWMDIKAKFPHLSKCPMGKNNTKEQIRARAKMGVIHQARDSIRNRLIPRFVEFAKTHLYFLFVLGNRSQPLTTTVTWHVPGTGLRSVWKIWGREAAKER